MTDRRPLRLLVLARSLHPGGAQRAQANVVAGLAARGHVVDLFYCQGGPLLSGYEAVARNVRRVPALHVVPRSPASVLGVLRTIAAGRRADHDAVYVSTYYDTFVAAAIARRRRIPVVCHLYQPRPSRRGAQVRLGMARVARFIAGSAHTRDEFIGSGVEPGRIDVADNGVDPARFVPATEPDRARARKALGVRPGARVVLFAGRLDREGRRPPPRRVGRHRPRHGRAAGDRRRGVPRRPGLCRRPSERRRARGRATAAVALEHRRGLCGGRRRRRAEPMGGPEPRRPAGGHGVRRTRRGDRGRGDPGGTGRDVRRPSRALRGPPAPWAGPYAGSSTGGTPIHPSGPVRANTSCDGSPSTPRSIRWRSVFGARSATCEDPGRRRRPRRLRRPRTQFARHPHRAGETQPRDRPRLRRGRRPRRRLRRGMRAHDPGPVGRRRPSPPADGRGDGSRAAAGRPAHGATPRRRGLREHPVPGRVRGRARPPQPRRSGVSPPAATPESTRRPGARRHPTRPSVPGGVGAHRRRARAAGIARERIDVVRQGVDLTYYRPDATARDRLRQELGIAPSSFVVGYAGRLDPDKGVEVLLDAWRQLGLAGDDGCLVVAGAPRVHASAAAADAFVRDLHHRAQGLRCVWLPRTPRRPAAVRRRRRGGRTHAARRAPFPGPDGGDGVRDAGGDVRRRRLSRDHGSAVRVVHGSGRGRPCPRRCAGRLARVARRVPLPRRDVPRPPPCATSTSRQTIAGVERSLARARETASRGRSGRGS